MKSQIASLAIMNCINDKKARRCTNTSGLSTLTFNKKGFTKMLKAIVAEMNHNLQPNDEQFTIEDALKHVNDYNAWVDETTEPITDDELEDMAQQEEAYRQRLYQQRDSSLTRFMCSHSLTA